MGKRRQGLYACLRRRNLSARCRRGADLTLSDGKWRIEDIGAHNGVTVNGRRITKPCILHQNDAITIGNRRLVVIKGSGKDVAK